MQYLLTPADEIIKRVNVLQSKLTDLELDGVLLTRNVDIFYFSGTMQNSYYFIPSSGEPILFVKKSATRAEQETPFKVEQMASIKFLPEIITKAGYKLDKLGIELDVLPYNQFQRIQKIFLHTDFSDISYIIRLQRSIKSNYEIELLKISAKVVHEIILEVPRILKPEMKELDLAAELERLARLKGHIGYMRMRGYNQELVFGMISSGSSAAKPTAFDGPAGGQGLTPAFPQGVGLKEININEPILIDIGTAVNGYIVDQTRIAVIGQLNPELERAYQVARDILKVTEKNAKPGTLWSEHYERALKIAEEADLKDYFMGYKEDQAKFLGHGVGLELDELPILAKGLDKPLELGMVIAIEPKFTFPGQGVVGLENTYVVKENGLELITDAPEQIIQISEKY